MKMVLKWVVIVFVVLIVIGAVFGPSDSSKQASSATAAPSPAPEAASSVTPDKPDTTNNFTAQQKNAIRTAEQYLMTQPFSRNGLIRQLSSDAGSGFEVADATVAVDSLTVDWNEEAAKSAKQYLEIQGFSCKGLIRQLSSSAGSGFTDSQARYGAKQAGAC